MASDALVSKEVPVSVRHDDGLGHGELRWLELKEAPEEYLPVLLDELEVLFGERRESVLDEDMAHERVVSAAQLLLDSAPRLFIILGSAGSGKSAVLSHLHTLIRDHHDATVRRLEADTSTRYFNLPSERAVPWPRSLVAVPCSAIALVAAFSASLRNVTEDGSALASALADAAWVSRRNGVDVDMEKKKDKEEEEEEEERVRFTRALVESMRSCRVVLLVDSLEHVSASERVPLLETLESLLRREVRTRHALPLVRVVVASRSVALLRQRLVPCTYLYLSPTLRPKAQLRLLSSLGCATYASPHARALFLTDAWLCNAFSRAPHAPTLTAFAVHVSSLCVPSTALGTLDSSEMQRVLAALGYLCLCVSPLALDVTHDVRGVAHERLSTRSAVCDALTCLLEARVGVFALVAASSLSASDVWRWWVEAVLAPCSLGSVSAQGTLWLAHPFVAQVLAAQFLARDEDASVALSALSLHSSWSGLAVTWSHTALVFAPQWRPVLDVLAAQHGALWLVQRLGVAALEALRAITRVGTDVRDRGQVRLGVLLRAHAIHALEHRADSARAAGSEALSEALGDALLSAIAASPAAVFHLDSYPVLSLACFTPIHARRLVQTLLQLAQRTGSAPVAHVLVGLARLGLLHDDDALLLRESLSKRPVVRVVREVALVKEKKVVARMLVEALGSSDVDVVDEAALALTKLASRALKELTASSPSASSTATSSTAPLFAHSTWSLALHSSLTLLTRLVHLGYHRVPPREEAQLQTLRDDTRAPACRVHQCQHLPYIVSLFETADAGTRLLAHLLLADLAGGNNFTKIAEEKKLAAMVAMLPLFDAHYAVARGGSDIVHEVSKHDALLHIVAKVVHATLGAEAAQALVLLEALVHAKLDLLVHCTTWLWAAMTHEARTLLYDELMAHNDSLVRVRALHLMSISAFPRDGPVAVSAPELQRVLEQTLLHAHESQLVRRQGLALLGDVSKQTSLNLHDGHLRVFVSTCAQLIETYGLSHQYLSEPVLRMLLVAVELRSGAARKEIVICAQQCKLKTLLVAQLRRKNAKSFWLGTCLCLELLQFLCDPSVDDDVEFFLASLLEKDLEVRRIAKAFLSQTSLTQSDKVFDYLSAKLRGGKLDDLVASSVVEVLGSRCRTLPLQSRDKLLKLVTDLIDSQHFMRMIFAANLLRYRPLPDPTAETLWKRLLLGDHLNNVTRGGWIRFSTFAVEALADAGTIPSVLFESALDAGSAIKRPEMDDAILQLVERVSLTEGDEVSRKLVSLLSASDHASHILALRILRALKGERVAEQLDHVINLVACENPDCRRCAFQCLASTVSQTRSSGKLDASKLQPVFQIGLGDSNPSVVAECIKLMIGQKSRKFLLMDLSYPLTLQIDTLFLKQVIEPASQKISSLLQSRKLRNSKKIRQLVFVLLAETDLLRDWMPLYSQIVNSDQISTLVEFAEAFRGLGPQVLQYVPHILQFVKSSGSPLVKHIVKLLQKATRNISVETCEEVFHITSLTAMLSHKDYSVRRVAAFLIGFKCDNTPSNVFLLANLWQDQNSRVRKQAIDSLGNLIKRSPSHLSVAVEAKVFEGFDSLLVWRSISLSAWTYLVSEDENAGGAGDD